MATVKAVILKEKREVIILGTLRLELYTRRRCPTWLPLIMFL